MGIGLPFKGEKETLGDNYNLAKADKKVYM